MLTADNPWSRVIYLARDLESRSCIPLHSCAKLDETKQEQRLALESCKSHGRDVLLWAENGNISEPLKPVDFQSLLYIKYVTTDACPYWYFPPIEIALLWNTRKGSGDTLAWDFTLRGQRKKFSKGNLSSSKRHECCEKCVRARTKRTMYVLVLLSMNKGQQRFTKCSNKKDLQN